MNDAVFGELEFNGYDWIGYKNVDFFGTAEFPYTFPTYPPFLALQ